MRKLKLVVLTGLVVVFCYACETKDVDKAPLDEVESNNNNLAVSDSNSETADLSTIVETVSTETGELSIRKVDKVLVDNESYKIVFSRIEDSTDSVLGKSTNLVFEVTNRLNVDLTFQADNLSIDGLSMSEKSYALSQDVASGKTTYIRVALVDSEGYSIPLIVNSFSMILDIFNWSDDTVGESLPVKIDLS